MVTKCTEALFFCVYPSHCSKRSVEAVSRKSPFSESFHSPLMCTCHIYHFLWWATVLACSRSLIWLFVQNFSGIWQSSWGSSSQKSWTHNHHTCSMTLSRLCRSQLGIYSQFDTYRWCWMCYIVFAAWVPSCTCPTHSEHFRFTVLLRFMSEEHIGPLAFKYQALNSLGS